MDRIYRTDDGRDACAGIWVFGPFRTRIGGAFPSRRWENHDSADVRNYVSLCGIEDQLSTYRETYVPYIGGIMVFSSDADGNAPPIRVLKDRTPRYRRMRPAVVCSVDSIHDLLFVGGGGRFFDL